MPYSRMLRTGAACLAWAAALIAPATTPAATTTAELRVVNSANTVLADQSQVTGDVTIRTDPGAKCFIGGTGGSGNNVSIPGPTAFGILKDASDTNAALRPLSVTDEFTFGLGVCGIGGFTPPTADGFWYLKVNHVGASEAADKLVLKAGDEILWYLTPRFPPPPELQLIAPTLAQAGKPFTVTVFSYDEAGKRNPVAGALVTGAESPTGADGTTSVELSRSVVLQALHGIDIPSNQEVVCVLTSKDTCGSTRHKVVGTKGPDKIRGTKMADQVKARGGDDRINTNGGLPDIVNCGRGTDRAVIGANDLTRRCESVIRKG